MGRDNLYERLHGLPKQSAEEIKKQKEKYKDYVSFQEFLPNSISKSPQRKLFSNTFKTKALDLYHMDKTLPHLEEHKFLS